MPWRRWPDRLRAHMKRVGITQEQLGEAMKVSQGGIGHWLTGRRNINLADFFQLCEKAKANPSEILFGVAVEAEEPTPAQLDVFLRENPAIAAMIARQHVPDERVAKAFPKPPEFQRVKKVAAHRRRQRGK